MRAVLEADLHLPAAADLGNQLHLQHLALRPRVLAIGIQPADLESRTFHRCRDTTPEGSAQVAATGKHLSSQGLLLAEAGPCAQNRRAWPRRRRRLTFSKPRSARSPDLISRPAFEGSRRT